ncbi:hypothetical protein C5C74_07870 [Rathayibacter sp. AY1E8]|jgi:hypothetical protein|nr:hypothetical protein C5B98_08470 [Rathayibacter sp. AY1A5]PPF48553.1 hypothetical protein C5E14_06595 [Rathayibacter sp. AY1A1]PPF71984.1 hypothetical protein C5C46_08610 [Rathayibacter sp. AY1E6]PPG19004.1 hypothetical protein C5C74_07870 [Rathayibacter sp. AY1E8]PPG81816.1 hypothetical protein C5C29_15015 [Rathayibacter sp. AY1H2]PPG95222.1 hypothetical protein C5C32_16380 [Rathayibacter sp. AY1G9]PPH00152.1 hypothetical protein C5C44_15915 [Rathayibacter sp. AY1F6]PPH34474.1 hypothetic
MTTEPHDAGSDRAMNALLDESAPPTPLAEAVSDSSLREMIRGAEWNARRGRRQATPRALVIGTVVALTLGGTGAAAAATLSGWEPWVANPDSVVHFTLPSGRECELRSVAKEGDPEDIKEMQDVLRTTDVLALADVDGELARIVARDVTVRGDDGDTVVPATELYSEDELYRQAVEGAIINVVWDELEDRGVVDPVTGSDLSFGSQDDCADLTQADRTQ